MTVNGWTEGGGGVEAVARVGEVGNGKGWGGRHCLWLRR